MKYIKREIYLRKIVNRRHNGEVKIVTGARRCGKSWLLSKIYKDYLLEDGVPEDHIISLSFDSDDDVEGVDLLDPQVLKQKHKLSLPYNNASQKPHDFQDAFVSFRMLLS